MTGPEFKVRTLDWLKVSAQRAIGRELIEMHPETTKVIVHEEINRMAIELRQYMLAENLLSDTKSVPFKVTVNVPVEATVQVPIPNSWWRNLLGLPEQIVPHTVHLLKKVAIDGSVPVRAEHFAAYPQHKLGLTPDQLGRPVMFSQYTSNPYVPGSVGEPTDEPDIGFVRFVQ